ncbi:hypothetical protein ACK1U3_18395 [Pseudomonas promysalinigenes]|uniref:hypothetical protein n=1 Tax=Pseudomonas promysalinigenes TaxID=485898 RepID=UPI003917412F
MMLFLAGGVFFNIIPEIKFKSEISISDFVGGLSAIAAAVAAYASWKAANISKQSAEDSKSFTRVQLYMSHREDFIELLDYIAAELKVVFFRKNDLYAKLFPNNHYSGAVFEAKASDGVIDVWLAEYEEIKLVTSREPIDLELDLWVMRCSTLSEEMHFVFPQSKEPQLYLHAFELPIQTQFTQSPARPVFYLGEVMNHLRSFSGYGKIEPLLLADHPFEHHFSNYFARIARGHPQHYVGHPNDKVTPPDP